LTARAAADCFTRLTRRASSPDVAEIDRRLAPIARAAAAARARDAARAAATARAAEAAAEAARVAERREARVVVPVVHESYGGSWGGTVAVRGHYRNGHWVRPYTRRRRR